MEDKGRTITVSTRMRVPFAPEAVWPLLCPVREYDWIEAWSCELVHSESGVNELGCVFRTAFPAEGDRETWITSRFEPPGRMEFVRSNSWRAIRFILTLESEPGGTRMTWTQYVTPLSAEGEAYVKAKPGAYEAQMTMLGEMLVHYLETGEMLRGRELGLTREIKTHVHRGKAG